MINSCFWGLLTDLCLIIVILFFGFAGVAYRDHKKRPLLNAKGEITGRMGQVSRGDPFYGFTA